MHALIHAPIYTELHGVGRACTGVTLQRNIEADAAAVGLVVLGAEAIVEAFTVEGQAVWQADADTGIDAARGRSSVLSEARPVVRSTMAVRSKSHRPLMPR